MFVALRDLWFARGRFALVGLVIGLVALMTTLVSGLASGLVDDGISGLRQLPVSHVSFQEGADAIFSRSSLTPDNLEPWDDAEGVQATPIGVSFFNARIDDGSTIDLALFGVEPDNFLVPSPEARTALESQRGIVLSDDFREEGLAVGDELTIVGVDQTLPILGFTIAGSYGHVDMAFSTLDTWRDLRFGNETDPRFSAIALQVQSGVDLDAVDAQAATTTETRTGAFKGSPGYTAETQTMSLIRTFLLVISATIVGAFFTVWTIQRSAEIGLLKAMGASTGYVIRDAIGQMAIVLLVATTIGTLVGIGLGQFVGSAIPFQLETQPVLNAAALLIIFGLVGCVLALRRITAVDPIVALRSAL